MLTEEELERKRAVSRYFSRESPKAICASMGRPKKWLYKWVARYRSGDADWFVDDSRRPKTMPTKTPDEMVAQVVAARESLASAAYADCGVFSIRQKLFDIGISDAPSDATIGRIIRSAGLVKKPEKRIKVGAPYPTPVAEGPNDVHQLDIWGPRYLGVGKICYTLNIIDVARRGPCINPIRSKTYNDLIPCLIRSWKTLGLPKVLQMDNFVLTSHPGAICRLLRLCLYVGVEPLLAPFKEPWRQGVVEKFNDFFNKSFFCQHRFENLLQMQEKALVFEEHCWRQRRLPALSGKTPSQVFPEAQVRLLPEDFAVDPARLGVTEGKISCIRLVRSNHQVDLLGRKFPVSESYYREYVKATLFTKENIIRLYHQGQQIAEFYFSKCKAESHLEG
jgi:transposase-like protein